MRVQAVDEVFVACPRRGCLAHHYNIESAELLFMHPERFTNDSFKAIPLSRQAAVLLRYRQSQPCNISRSLPRQYRKQLVPTPVRFFENALKGFSVLQAILSPKPPVRRIDLI